MVTVNANIGVSEKITLADAIRQIKVLRQRLQEYESGNSGASLYKGTCANCDQSAMRIEDLQRKVDMLMLQNESLQNKLNAFAMSNVSAMNSFAESNGQDDDNGFIYDAGSIISFNDNNSLSSVDSFGSNCSLSIAAVAAIASSNKTHSMEKKAAKAARLNNGYGNHNSDAGSDLSGQDLTRPRVGYSEGNVKKDGKVRMKNKRKEKIKSNNTSTEFQSNSILKMSSDPNYPPISNQSRGERKESFENENSSNSGVRNGHEGHLGGGGAAVDALAAAKFFLGENAGGLTQGSEQVTTKQSDPPTTNGIANTEDNISAVRAQSRDRQMNYDEIKRQSDPPTTNGFASSEKNKYAMRTQSRDRQMDYDEMQRQYQPRNLNETSLEFPLSSSVELSHKSQAKYSVIQPTNNINSSLKYTAINTEPKNDSTRDFGSSSSPVVTGQISSLNQDIPIQSAACQRHSLNNCVLCSIFSSSPQKSKLFSGENSYSHSNSALTAKYDTTNNERSPSSTKVSKFSSVASGVLSDRLTSNPYLLDSKKDLIVSNNGAYPAPTYTLPQAATVSTSIHELDDMTCPRHGVTDCLLCSMAAPSGKRVTAGNGEFNNNLPTPGNDNNTQKSAPGSSSLNIKKLANTPNKQYNENLHSHYGNGHTPQYQQSSHIDYSITSCNSLDSTNMGFGFTNSVEKNASQRFGKDATTISKRGYLDDYALDDDLDETSSIKSNQYLSYNNIRGGASVLDASAREQRKGVESERQSSYMKSAKPLNSTFAAPFSSINGHSDPSQAKDLGNYESNSSSSNYNKYNGSNSVSINNSSSPYDPNKIYKGTSSSVNGNGTQFVSRSPRINEIKAIPLLRSVNYDSNYDANYASNPVNNTNNTFPSSTKISQSFQISDLDKNNGYQSIANYGSYEQVDHQNNVISRIAKKISRNEVQKDGRNLPPDQEMNSLYPRSSSSPSELQTHLPSSMLLPPFDPRSKSASASKDRRTAQQPTAVDHTIDERNRVGNIIYEDTGDLDDDEEEGDYENEGDAALSAGPRPTSSAEGEQKALKPKLKKKKKKKAVTEKSLQNSKLRLNSSAKKK